MANASHPSNISNNANNQLPEDCRPTTLNMTTTMNTITDHEHPRHYNINHIPMTPSPIDRQPRMFQPGTIINATTFARIEAEVCHKLNVVLKEEQKDEEEDDDDEDNEDDETTTDDEQGLDQILYQARDTEIEQLSQLIITQQPMDDTTAQYILQQLQVALDSTNTITNVHDTNDQQVLTASSSMMATKSQPHPYPPIQQTGPIQEYDRPYAEYGHLDRATIARECQFNLQPRTTNDQSSRRLNTKSFAITSWTNVAKDLVMNTIKEEFGIENIRYICIGEEISELNHQRHLHIQIILKGKINKKAQFLDAITETHCNYQVTKNDIAWNEYIKKEGNYIEFNEFKSTRARGQTYWPSSSSSSSSTAAAAAAAAVPKATKTTVRAQAEEKNKQQEEIIIQAMHLAETSTDQAMDFIRRSMPIKFFNHSTWYLATFNYIHLRAQRDADQRGDIDKEFVWPMSFPDCTPSLREAMNQWIRHHFFRAKRAKCLILIGPSGTGKTAFALSLPGRVNYFQQRWNLDLWNDYARYSVYDDVPWNDFSKHNFPRKKNLLTQKTTKFSATDKYRVTKEISARQPAIVLLNPEDAGSLLEEPLTRHQQNTADYWNKRAFIYIMGSNEYFYKRRRRSKEGHSTANNNQPLSSNSSMSSNDERMGEPDEWEKMYQRFQEKRQK